MIRIECIVTLGKDQKGFMQWHISRPGYGGIASDDYRMMQRVEMIADLGKELVDIIVNAKETS